VLHPPLDRSILFRLALEWMTPAMPRRHIEEAYLAAHARSTMPNADPEEIERAKAGWRLEVRVEQAKAAASEATRRSHIQSPTDAFDEAKKRLADSLKRFLRARGMTHAEFGARAVPTLGERTISRFLSKSPNCSAKTLQTIEETLRKLQ
jgi:hypothetical protein